MWLSDTRIFRRTFLLGALGALAACGFEPAYGPGQGGRLVNNVIADAPREFPDYQFVRHIEARLGRPGAPRYALSYSIELQTDSASISEDDVTLRYNQIAEITYALRDIASGEVLTSGKVDSFTSYSATGTTVATAAAEKDATARLMSILSEQVLTRLAAVSQRFPA